MSILLLNLALFALLRFCVPQAEEIGFLAVALSVFCIYSKRLSALLTGFLCACVVHILIYGWFAGLSFSFYQILENPIDAGQSVILSLGEWGTVLILMEFAVTVMGVAWLVERYVGAWHLPQRARLAALVLLSLPALSFAATWGKHLLAPRQPIRIQFAGGDRPTAAPQSAESLIVLQLESVNSAVLFNDRMPLPGLAKLREMGGSFIPNMWSNSFGTQLGMSSILCGTSGALTARLVRPEDGTPCMPERFRRAGFETSFYYSYRDAEFYRMREHVGALGFKNFHFGEELMGEKDTQLEWGYQDCRFYDRAFAHMQASGLSSREKIFVHMSVHMNHVPFTNHLEIEHPFAQPADLEENYLNSAYEQEYCVARFLEHVQKLGRNDLNVVIVGDHGFPINPRWGTHDDFSTSFYFLPAQRARSKYRQGELAKVQVSQDQILETVLEIFGEQPSSRSFAWALRGEAQPGDYRRCTLLTDFTRDLAVVVEGERQIARKIRSDLFFGGISKGKEQVSNRRLLSSRDWQDFQLDPQCLKLIGAPGS